MTVYLTENEKSRVRRHLGYPEIDPSTAMTAGLLFAMPRHLLLETNMDKLTLDGANRVRELLGVLDAVEKKMLKAACYVTVDSIGDIRMRPATGKQGTDLLEREYVRWAERLSDVVGCPMYPYAKRFNVGKLNVRVTR